MTDVSTNDEVTDRDDGKGLWVMIDGTNYNLAKIKEQPDGEEKLRKLSELADRSVAEGADFEEIMRKDQKIGEIINGNSDKSKTTNAEIKEPMEEDYQQQEPNKEQVSWSSTFICFSFIIYAIIIYYWSKKLGL